MEHEDAEGVVLIRVHHQLVLQISQSNLHVGFGCLPVAANFRAYLPLLLHTSDLRLENVPIKLNLRLNGHHY